MHLLPAQWAHVERLFGEAAALAPELRSGHVERAVVDPEVRREVAAMVAAIATGGDFLSNPVKVIGVGTPDGDLTPGTRLGPWRVLRLVGRGGMGEVYEAERADGAFEQRAAIKLLSRESEPLLDQFHVERQILARLDHPGIARLLDGGVTPSGQPYAVMEYIVGRTLGVHCRDRGAPLEERLRLFLQVCAAVADAHRNRIVHGDLKPANILVDPGGRVRLLDFGVARLLDPPEAPGGRVAGAEGTSGPRSFTPAYAAPEQLSGDAITAATDVHALGLLLFELLTGRRARAPADARHPGGHASAERPLPLASQAAADAARAPVPPRRLRGDLDAIVARCVRRAPAERYAGVEHLRLDVERTLRGEPVSVRAGRLYLVGRFLLRHRAAAWGGAAALIMVAALALGVPTRDRVDRGAAPRTLRTSNPEVRSQYLLGHRFLARESRDGMRRAVLAFERALELEPDHAPSLAGLSLALTLRRRLGWTGDGWGDEGRRALQAAEQAVAMAPDLAQAHAARGKARSWIAWDWAGALLDLELAVRLEPDDPLVQQQYSNLLASLGRLPEAVAAARRATELDPLRGRAWQLLSDWQALRGQLGPARQALARVIEINPDSEGVQGKRFELALWERDPRRALEELGPEQRAVCLRCVAMAQHSLGDAVESQRALDALLASSSNSAPYQIAAVYAWRGEHDRAFAWLDRAAALRHPDLVFVKVDPALRGLRGDPRFGALLERMNLPPE